MQQECDSMLELGLSCIITKICQTRENSLVMFLIGFKRGSSLSFYDELF